jgi:hypothetical protein
MKELWKCIKRKIEVRPDYQTVEADRQIEAATDGKYESLEELAEEVARRDEDDK